MAITIPAPLRVLFHFIVHTMCATVLFATVAAAAILLWLGTLWMQSFGVPYGIWIVCFWTAELLFWFDVALFGFYVVRQGVNLVKEIWLDDGT